MKNDLNEALRTAGLFIAEGGKRPSFSGDDAQVAAIRRVMLASRNLYEALQDKKATLSVITTLLDEKRCMAVEYEKVFGHPWCF